MTNEEFNAFCGALPATSHVVQWGDAHVWKVGGKVFVFGRWREDAEPSFSFKVSELSYEMLKELALELEHNLNTSLMFGEPTFICNVNTWLAEAARERGEWELLSELETKHCPEFLEQRLRLS